MRERLKQILVVCGCLSLTWAKPEPQMIINPGVPPNQQYFVCQMSNGVTISVNQVCNGYPDCPYNEDESICYQNGNNGGFPDYGSNFVEPPNNMALIPEGLVKLPDHLQQKQYSYGFPGSNGMSYPSTNMDYPSSNMDYPSSNMDYPMMTMDYPSTNMGYPSMSMCNSPPPQTACSLPWTRPAERYYFNPQSSSCQSFQSYSSCGGPFTPNQFNSVDECMSSCLSNSYQPMPDYMQPNTDQGSFACQNGPMISLSQVCNGIPDCPFGEDESNCATNQMMYQPTVNMNGNDNINNINLAVQPVNPSSVIVLMASNFDSAIAAHPRILVKFYSSQCHTCQEFLPKYKDAADTAKRMNLGVTFAQVDCDAEPFLKERFNVNSYPKILLYDSAFPMGMPRQFYKSYGLTSNQLLTWLQKQIMSTQGPSLTIMPCQMGQFQCGNGRCLEEHLVCDGFRQCPDGSDEQMCAPKPIEPPAKIPEPQKPDVVVPQANQGQDQQQACDFQCRDGTCQPMAHRCDGKKDCLDGIDEDNCIPVEKPPCQRTEFTCHGNGKCLDYLKRCDGQQDCEDGSDEYLCNEIQCAKTEFICEDRTCINYALRCDGNIDCPDQSDEYQCPRRCDTNTQFTCNNGQCIDKKLRCDGVPNCRDSTDEISCESNIVSGLCDDETQWECANHRRCIDKRRLCDGYFDCGDNSDEDQDMCQKMECQEEWQYQCLDRQRCIDKRRRCDGYQDCLDGSDEGQCTEVRCDYWQFKCNVSALCIDSRRRCDGTNDCGSNEDEEFCDSVTPNPYLPEYLPTPTRAPAPAPLPTTLMPIVTVPVPNERDCPQFCSTLMEPVCGTNGQTYNNECLLKMANCTSDQRIHIYSSEPCPVAPAAPPPTSPPNSFERCKDGWNCRNLDCINTNQICDGIADCDEGEDEKFCPSPPDEVPEYAVDLYFPCYDGSQFRVSQRCDGLPDCPDGEDETNCENQFESSPQVKPPPMCDPLDEFTCKDGTCRPKDIRCDGMVDCEDESDEFDCPMDATTLEPTESGTTTDPFAEEDESVNWFGEDPDFIVEEEETTTAITPTDTSLLGSNDLQYNDTATVTTSVPDTIPAVPSETTVLYETATTMEPIKEEEEAATTTEGPFSELDFDLDDEDEWFSRR